MGQKTNASIFRLGITKKSWNSKQFEKTKEEASFYLYNNLEFNHYLNRFFKLHKLHFHSYKVHYSPNLLKFFICYYTTLKSTQTKPSLNPNFSLKDSRDQKPKVLKYKRFALVKKIKTKLCYDQFNSKQISNANNFGELLLESLSIYTKKKIEINLTFQNINTHLHTKFTSQQTKNLKEILLQFKKYVKDFFFREALNILVISLSLRNSAKLLAEFLANQFKINQSHNSKKDNYFLNFLKKILNTCFLSSLSFVKGIKIKIKGRINKVSRAKSEIIQVGTVPLQSFNTKIDYYQSTAYTVNGTFGVKVWICEN